MEESKHKKNIAASTKDTIADGDESIPSQVEKAWKKLINHWVDDKRYEQEHPETYGHSEEFLLPSTPTPDQMFTLLHNIKLPAPIELTKIAATIGPGNDPDKAIRNAVRLYLRATAFQKQYEKASLTELALAADDVALSMYLIFEKTEEFRLEMDRRSDSVRTYLKKRGIRINAAKNVKINLLEYARYLSQVLFVALKSKQSITLGLEDGKEEEIERRARAAGWKEPQDLMKELRIVQESRTDNRKVFRVPKTALDHLVDFKKARKRLGGLKSLKCSTKKPPQN